MDLSCGQWVSPKSVIDMTELPIGQGILDVEEAGDGRLKDRSVGFGRRKGR